MNHHAEPGLLDRIHEPSDMKNLSIDQLRRLAAEVRTETIRCVACTGGHLGASLGVVELTIALHHLFDTPGDRLIWDVGHQCYPHKILTGRRARMTTLRQGGGLSGFTRRSESPYDPFGAAHSSTSISAGLGMAAARDLKHENRRIVCVIGDGALSAGMAYEALNNLGASGRRVIVILNDNGMSIAPAVGALTGHLAALAAGRAGGNLFESLGLRYQGPIDGHDLTRLVPALRALRDEDPACGPVLLHVLTRKGKGYGPAEAAADKYHGVGCFDPVTGKQRKAPAMAPAYTRIFADALIAEAARDPAIVAITAGMPAGTGLDRFSQHFPDRCFDAGIAEQHAVTFAAGLAAEGMKPFAAIYSTFLQRGYDQVVHDVVLQKLPVRFAIDRAGLVGQDGPTHMGAYDLAYLCCLPGMVVMAPADEAELVHMVATAAAYDDGPCAVRYPRGEGHGLALPERGAALEIGKGRILRDGERVAILALGPRLAEALRAAESLAELGIAATVADARFAKPLDGDLIARLARDHEVLITIEDGAAGGFAAHVAQFLAWCGLLDRGLKFRPMVMPDRFIEQDSPEAQSRAAGLTAGDIAATALAALDRNDGTVTRRLSIV